MHRKRPRRVNLVELVWTCPLWWGLVASEPRHAYGSDMPKGELPPEESLLPEEASSSDKKNPPQEGSSSSTPDKSPSKSPNSPPALSHPKEKNKEKRCTEGYLGLIPHQMVFDSQGKYLYLLVDNPAKNPNQKDKKTPENPLKKSDPKTAESDKKPSPTPSKETNRTRKTIVRLEVKTGQKDLLLSSALKNDAVLMHQLGGISALNFVGSQSECGFGKTMIVSMKLGGKSKGAQAVQHTGSFRMVQSPGGWILADLKKNVMLEMDSEQFQKRTIRKLLPEGFPLYYNEREPVLVHWLAKGSQKGILFERGTVEKKQKKVAIPVGEYLVVSRSGLAIVSTGKEQNMVIQTLKGFNSQSNPSHFNLQLPPGVTLDQLSLDIDLTKNHALAIGHNVLTRKTLQKAWIYDLSKASPLAAVEPSVELSATGFVQAGLLSPDGEVAAFKIAPKEGSGFEAVRLFHFKTQQFVEYPLDQLAPKSPAPLAP